MRQSGLRVITALGGLSSAILVLLPMTFPVLIILYYFAPLPLFLLGLSRGLRPLLEAGFLATACLFLFEGPSLTTEFFLFSFLGPAFLVHRALINCKKPSGEIVWYPPSFFLRDTTLFSGIITTISLGTYLYLTQGENLHTIIKNIVHLLDPQGHIKGLEILLIKIFPFFPGFFTFSWLLLMMLNASIAQAFLTRFKANLRPTPSFKAIQLPKSFLIVLGLSLLLSFVGVGTLELLGKNAALTLAFPFFLSGLGVVHYLFHKIPFAKAEFTLFPWPLKISFAKIGLTLFYCILLLFIWPILLIIFLGILRPWIEKPTAIN